MAIAADPRPLAASRWRARLLSPTAILVGAILIVCALLMLPLSLPIGPMYWDVYIYFDAANRIADGQIPIVDFFTPVGPLGYYLFAGLLKLFPQAQPTLLAHWSMLVVTAPLMVLVVRETGQRSRPTALALLIPFLIFALLPFNTRSFYPFPGSDAFGIYNRQCCQLLYVLVASLIFVRNSRLLCVVVTGAMLALFLTKITGFVAGGIICAFAFAAGRVPLRAALAVFAVFAVALGVLEMARGLISQYVVDIVALVTMNGGTLLPRFLLSTSLNFGLVLPAVVLIFFLLWTDRPVLAKQVATLRRSPSLTNFTSLLNHNALWLGAVLFAGILFETQNTGSQSLIFLWPVAMAVLLKARSMLARPMQMLGAATLVAAIALPPVVTVVEGAARAYIGGLKNEQLASSNLQVLGRVTMRPEVAIRSEQMLAFYPKHRAAFDELVSRGELPAPLLYSDFDFQIAYLKGVDRAIDSIRSLETAHGVRFETIMSLNFTNPFPWLMERSAPLHIAIGADPFRAVPAPGSREEQAVADTDLVLLPTCPPTTANAELLRMYSPGLVSHRRITLNTCYDAFVHPRFAGKLGS